MSRSLSRSSLLFVSVVLMSCTYGQTLERPNQSPTAVEQQSQPEGELLIHQMRRMLSDASVELKQARLALRVQRIVCVGETHAVMRTAVVGADRHHKDYVRARHLGERRRAHDALLKISIAHARVDVLHGRLSSCGRSVH